MMEKIPLGIKVVLGFACIPLGALAWQIVKNVPKFIYKLLSKSK